MDPIDPRPSVQSIRELASRATRTLAPRSLAGGEARARVRRPVDYMRCAEFTLASAQLSIAPGMRVLDVASPQWFSLLLASRFPAVRFDYVNIMDEELDAVREVAACLGLENICHHRQDARALSFLAGHFDRAISISVIEHIAPEVGGDALALEEVRRVLKPGGKLTLSVPLKETARVAYAEGAVYERAATGKNFFAREYDAAQFRGLMQRAGFEIEHQTFIVERPGLLALDYWEWGPGKASAGGWWIPKLVKMVERATGRSMEDRLAMRYLRSSPDVENRVVNVVATTAKAM